MADETQSLTGYRRPKSTQRRVALADRMAKRVISAGGVAVIGAVLGILVYLVIQVLPLFRGGTVTGRLHSNRPAPWEVSSAMLMDEYGQLALEISPDGRAMAYHPASGEIVSGFSIHSYSMAPAAIALDRLSGSLAAGFADGSVAIGSVRFHAETLPAGFDISGMRRADNDNWISDGAVYSRITGGQTRKTWVEAGAERLIYSPGGPAVSALAISSSGSEGTRSQAVAALDGEGYLRLHICRDKKNMMTGQMKSSVRSYAMPAPSEPISNPILLIMENGSGVLLAEEDGTLFRYNAQDPDKIFLAETVRLTPPNVRLTAIGFLSGGQSLAVGGSDGGVAIHYILPKPGAGAADGLRLAKARKLEPHHGPVMAIAPAAKGKSFLTAGPEGVWLRSGSGERILLRLDNGAGPHGKIRGMAAAPEMNGALLAWPDGRVESWRINAPHPESSWRAFFGKMWYEGYPQAGYTWQSSSASDDFQPKLSLIPLIFGTLKASFYSMLFAAPAALLAAVFTSEFLDKRFRAPLKTMMEMMASLPSVALGFVAALVLAPVAERSIGPILLLGLTLPLLLILGAYAWQLLPRRVADRLSGGPKLLAISAALLAGIAAAWALGGEFERAFFGGDFKLWLSGPEEGSGAPFLFILFLPMAAGLTALAGARFGSGIKGGSGAAEFGGAMAVSASALILALSGAVIADWLGLDARNGLVGPYAQRNTLIVGFAMGFAVIPIIYTIAEDALSSVPDHLRAASLGCGATVWQTAVWVVIPAAASGIFSAIMIGMGRAVGETMIVVMAAGNTPVMELNVFSGLRALSATIAVELPEAEVGGTLYRTLFLAGLTLFLMTFVINTAAEIVRIRFRKRFSNL